MFLREAERHVGEGIYWLACFESQQAVELYLKALIVGLAGAHPYTHDIVELLETIKGLGIEVPEELVLYGDSLTPTTLWRGIRAGSPSSTTGAGA